MGQIRAGSAAAWNIVGNMLSEEISVLRWLSVILRHETNPHFDFGNGSLRCIEFRYECVSTKYLERFGTRWIDVKGSRRPDMIRLVRENEGASKRPASLSESGMAQTFPKSVWEQP